MLTIPELKEKPLKKERNENKLRTSEITISVNVKYYLLHFVL